jgi:hypothetical protein
VLQLRFEEGTPDLHLRLTNSGDSSVQVASVRLAGPLSTPDAVPVVAETRTIAPGAVMTAPTAHEKPRCDAIGEPVTMVATLSDGSATDVELDAAGTEQVDRLVDRLCGLERVAESVRIRFLPSWRTSSSAGRPALVGTLALDRQGDASRDLDVVGVRGSVLLEFSLQASRDDTSLSGDERSARLPVTLMPTGRCDGHALSQSQQTFLLSVFLRLEGESEQALIVSPGTGVRDRAMSLVRRGCGV